MSVDFDKMDIEKAAAALNSRFARLALRLASAGDDTSKKLLTEQIAALDLMAKSYVAFAHDAAAFVTTLINKQSALDQERTQTTKETLESFRRSVIQTKRDGNSDPDVEAMQRDMRALTRASIARSINIAKHASVLFDLRLELISSRFEAISDDIAAICESDRLKTLKMLLGKLAGKLMGLRDELQMLLDVKDIVTGIVWEKEMLAHIKEYSDFVTAFVDGTLRIVMCLEIARLEFHGARFNSQAEVEAAALAAIAKHLEAPHHRKQAPVKRVKI